VGADVDEIVCAYAVGVETMCALGRCLNHTHYERGWHPTATLGIFGAAAAAARLMWLSEEATVRALSICASFASGLTGNFGTVMKPFQVGFAAAKGVQAADLAELGTTASPAIMNGPGSFAGAFNAAVAPDWSRLSDLDSTWELVVPGLVFKLYPYCGSTHAAIEAARELTAGGAPRPSASEIEAIDIWMHPRRLPHTDNPFPVTPAQARFSVQYATAVTLARGDVSAADFAPDAIADLPVRRLLERTRVGEQIPMALDRAARGRESPSARSHRLFRRPRPRAHERRPDGRRSGHRSPRLRPGVPVDDR